MGELAVWLFIGGLAAAFFYYMWPVLLLIVGVATVAWIAGLFIERSDSTREYTRQQRADLIARADKQHSQIMSGDDVSGTYGIYLPPQGLR